MAKTTAPERTEQRDDEFARKSFTFRRMQPWQIWTMATVVTLLIVGFVGAYYL